MFLHTIFRRLPVSCHFFNVTQSKCDVAVYSTMHHLQYKSHHNESFSETNIQIGQLEDSSIVTAVFMDNLLTLTYKLAN
jgi:hypothetical protein